ncbi:MAG: AI-2E family transporter [Sphaerochaetaceae bacterium]
MLDKSTFKKIATLVVGAILFAWGLQNPATVGTLLGYLGTPLVPFIIGACIAFIINVPMHAIENHVFSRGKPVLRRALSLTLSILLLVAAIVLLLFIVIPEISQSIETLSAQIPDFIEQLKSQLDKLEAKYPELGTYLFDFSLDWDTIKSKVLLLLKQESQNIMNSTLDVATSVFSTVINVVLGLVFAVYILIRKETLQRQIKKLFYAYGPENRVDRLMSVCSLSARTFSRFITGQCTEAVILGLMFLVALLVFRFPYAVLISVLITVCALIPIFGAFVACFVGAFLILVADPVRAIWFVALFLGLQQIEGNLIYPRVVGSSVGLPALWVLAAVVLGSKTFGVLGMLVGVPLCAVIYVLLRESVGKHLAERRIAREKTES